MKRHIAIVALLAAATAAYGQNINASITGTVRDASGAVLPGATVVATNTATGLARTATTGETGDYVLNPLPPGSYTVSAEGKSFRKEIREGVVLQIDQRARLDFSLALATTQQEVVKVTAEAPVVDSESSALGQVINNTQVLQMPLNGRDFAQLMLLAPGVTAAPRVGSAGSGYTISGNRSDSNTFVIDGADNVEPGVVTVTVAPSIEMIQEFKLEENNYTAEFGRRSGGQINLTTKSGTNQYHGSAYDFLRNDALDARNYFSAPNAPPPPLRRNQFGASFGGKIKRDKTFIFLNWESNRLRQGVTGRTSVPTAAMKTGDFSELLRQGNAYTRNGAPLPVVNATSRAPYPGNVIPASQIDPIGSKIAALFRAGISRRRA